MNVAGASPQRFWRHRPDPRAKARLICLPYAGGTSKIYDSLAASLAGRVELYAVEYAGRGLRYGEPVPRSVGAVVEQLGPEVQKLTDRPYAILGYSMGAHVAFELTRWLRARNAPAPAHLLVCAARPPHVADPRRPTYSLPEPSFLAELRALGGVPNEIWQHPELLSMLLPIVRADLEASQTYLCREDAPLDLPIDAFAATRDPLASPDEVRAWRTQTSARFEITIFEEGHFFLQTARNGFADAVARALARTLGI